MILDELGLELVLKITLNIFLYIIFSYLDLCLIHWPMGYKEGDELFPKVDNKILLSDIDFTETWAALEKAVYNEKVRSIGLSNFNRKQIDRIVENCRIRPAVLQVFLNYFNVLTFF